MPKPSHICSCGRIIPHGLTCPCKQSGKRARDQRHDATRPSARQRGYSSKWEQVRQAFLAAHPHCAMCHAPATVVDHVIPHRGDMNLFWDSSNWQPLCQHHHNSAKQRQERQL